MKGLTSAAVVLVVGVLVFFGLYKFVLKPKTPATTTTTTPASATTAAATAATGVKAPTMVPVTAGTSSESQLFTSIGNAAIGVAALANAFGIGGD